MTPLDKVRNRVALFLLVVAKKLTTEMTVDAACLIEQVGLNKGDYWPGWEDHGNGHDGAAPVCAVGALVAASGEWRTARDIERRLYDILPPHDNVADMADWNDLPETTAEDVMSFFLEAAADG